MLLLRRPSNAPAAQVPSARRTPAAWRIAHLARTACARCTTCSRRPLPHDPRTSSVSSTTPLYRSGEVHQQRARRRAPTLAEGGLSEASRPRWLGAADRAGISARAYSLRVRQSAGAQARSVAFIASPSTRRRAGAVRAVGCLRPSWTLARRRCTPDLEFHGDSTARNAFEPLWFPSAVARCELRIRCKGAVPAVRSSQGAQTTAGECIRTDDASAHAPSRSIRQRESVARSGANSTPCAGRTSQRQPGQSSIARPARIKPSKESAQVVRCSICPRDAAGADVRFGARKRPPAGAATGGTKFRRACLRK